jgi:hypothetical protein
MVLLLQLLLCAVLRKSLMALLPAILLMLVPAVQTKLLQHPLVSSATAAAGAAGAAIIHTADKGTLGSCCLHYCHSC